MTPQSESKKWYGKIAYRSEGVINYIEGTRSECEAYVRGFKFAQTQLENTEEDNPLEDFVTSVDQIEMVDE